MLSCLDVLFNVNEKQIYEDFLEIYELVETETYHINRSTPFNYPDLEMFSIENYLTNYLNQTAFLSENIVASGASISSLTDTILFSELYKTGKIWYLGVNNVDSSKIYSKPNLKCGQYSCYEKSLRKKEICKQGKVYLFIIDDQQRCQFSRKNFLKILSISAKIFMKFLKEKHFAISGFK